MNMAMKLNYRPSDLGYYTTWWLTAKPSISSQTRTSPKTCIKFDDKCVAIQQDINQDDFKSNCCIPMKRFRIKR